MPETIYRNQQEILEPQYISQGKTFPGISLELKNPETQTVIDLSAASITLTWRKYNPDSSSWTDLTPENDPTGDENGILNYEFSENDTAIKGIYFAQFQIEYANGNKEAIPCYNGIQINIV